MSVMSMTPPPSTLRTRDNRSGIRRYPESNEVAGQFAGDEPICFLDERTSLLHFISTVHFCKT